MKSNGPVIAISVHYRLMLAFMMIACLLSMWITNSAVTAMLLPIVKSILNEIFDVKEKSIF